MIPMAAWAADVDVDARGKRDQLIRWPSMPPSSTPTAAPRHGRASRGPRDDPDGLGQRVRAGPPDQGAERCSGSSAGIRKGGT